MNTVYLATITKAGMQILRFVVYDDRDRAAYLAGHAMDALCDYHGGTDWDFSIEPLPYIGSMTPENRLTEWALSKAAI